jgi:MFS family permease
LVSQTQTSNRWRSVVRGNVLMMGFVSLFTDFSSEMMNPLLPIFIAGLVPLGLAPVYVGLMEGVAETTASLLKMISGRVSDALGKRKAIVVLGYGISTLLRPAMALAGGGWQVVLMKLGDRVGKGLRTAPRDALIGDAVGPEVRGLAFSFHRAMDHTGAVLGPLAAFGLLYGLLGSDLWTRTTLAPTGAEMAALRWLFGIALVPGLLAMLTLVGKVREIAPHQMHAVTADRANGKLSGQFYVFVGIVTLFALGNSSDMFLLLYAQTKFGLSLAALVGLWIVLHLSKIVWSIPGGLLSDRLGRRPLIVTGWIVYALVYLGMALATRQWHFWALFVVYGIYYGMCEGVEKALVTDFVPSAHRGRAFGIYHGAIGFAALPASLLFGVFWKEIGPSWAFGIGAGLAGVAALLLLVMLSVSRGSAETSTAPPGTHGQLVIRN